MTAGIIALLLFAPLVVVPLGLRRIPPATDPYARRLAILSIRASVPAGVSLTVAYLLPQGVVAAALSVPWLIVAALAASAAAVDLIRNPARSRSTARLGTDIARLFLAVGAAWAFADRIGLRPFGFPATIVLLTAVHFHFAGFALPIAGAFASSRRPTRWIRLAIWPLIVGIPMTALGFFDLPWLSWAGSMLVALGGLGIGWATWRTSHSLESRPGRALAWIGGLSLLVSMPMAVTYATGTLVGSTWLDLPTMARVHGSLNVLGFAVPTVLAWTLDERSRRTHRGPATPFDVVSFNWPPFVFGPVVAVAAAVGALLCQPSPLAIVLGGAAMAAIVATTTALVAVVWVFNAGSERRWSWVARVAESPAAWLNVTTGFDDSTSTLTERLPGTHGATIDVVDAIAELDGPQRRARHRFPPGARSATPGTLGWAIRDDGPDCAFLLMAAHEVPRRERPVLFETLAKRIGPAGRIVVVEHLRDLPNALAFGLGARHFQSRETWLDLARDAGLSTLEERRLSPFVRGFVFGRTIA